jgi:hypothetical protein
MPSVAETEDRSKGDDDKGKWKEENEERRESK